MKEYEVLKNARILYVEDEEDVKIHLYGARGLHGRALYR